MRDQRREKNNMWKGGRFKANNGYIWVLKPEHPNAMTCSPKGYVLEHRLVVEEKLGRYLTRQEIVHHLNGLRDDNRLKNLHLTDRSEHVAIHHFGRKLSQEAKDKIRIFALSRPRNNRGDFIKIGGAAHGKG